MAHIVIIGAGTGGMAGAYEMREALGPSHEITLINERDIYQFVPSNPWVGVGWRKREDITFDAGPCLSKKNIEFIARAVVGIDPAQNRLTLIDDSIIDYDYLVITTGPKLNFAAVPGCGPDSGFTQSVCTIDHAEKSHRDFQRLLEDPGPVLVGAMPGASCFGPAYEYALILDAELRKRRLRDRVPITYVTPEPYIGHLGLGGVGDSKLLLESELRGRHIKWITNAKVTEVRKNLLLADELDDVGALKRRHELAFKHAMFIPAFAGVDAVASVEGLCNAKGFVMVDEYQRNPTYPNIYSAGVCIAIPPVEETPVPVGAPKTGYMIESMITAIVGNIRRELAAEAPCYKGSWSAVCLADMGDTGAAFVAIPQIPPRNITWFKKGKWVHYAKVAFEKYFIRKMKRGYTEPVYEKYILRALGLKRLKE